jgi:hypothetical protein
MGVVTRRLRLVQDAALGGPERSGEPPTVLFEEIHGRLHQFLHPQAAEATSAVLRSLLERGTMVVAVYVFPGGAFFRVLEDEDAEPLSPASLPDASVHP